MAERSSEQEIEEFNGQVVFLHRQGMDQKALELAWQTCELCRSVLGDRHALAAESLNNLGFLLQRTGNTPEARRAFELALEIDRAILGEDHPDTATDCANLGGLLHELGDPIAAKFLYERALAARIKSLGELHHDTATSLNNLGLLLRSIGDIEAASRYFERALEAYLHSSGEDHPDTATCLNNLGLLLREAGNHQRARGALERALEIRRKVLGGEHSGTASSLNNLGAVLQDLGEYEAACLHLQEALAIYRARGESEDVAICLNNLGFQFHKTGNFEMARARYEEALQIRVATLGENHLDTAGTLDNLSALFRAQGDTQAAERHSERALAITRASVGEDHPDFALRLNGRGNLAHDRGEYEEAKSSYERALEINRRHLGEHHAVTATTLNNLGLLFQDLGNYPEARTFLEGALATRRAVLGERHEETAASMNALATLFVDIGDHRGASPLLERALSIRGEVLGEEHLDTASTRNNLGTLLYALGDFRGARPHFERSLAACLQSLRADHPETAARMNNLGTLLQALGEFSDAKSWYVQALGARQRAYGEDHVETALVANNLGTLLHDMGDHHNAITQHERALRVRRRLLGKDHPSTATSLNNLASAYAAAGRVDDAWTLLREASAIHDRLIADVLGATDEDQRMALLVSLRGAMEAFLSFTLGHGEQIADAAAASYDLVLRRKGLGIEALAAQRDAVLGGRYPTSEPRLNALRALRMRIARKTLAGPDPRGSDAHGESLLQDEREKKALEVELAREIPEMRLRLGDRVTDHRTVARALSPGWVLVEFVRFSHYEFGTAGGPRKTQWRLPHYAVFVMHGGEPDSLRMIDLGEAGPIDLLISDFRAGIAGGGGGDRNRHMNPRPSGSSQYDGPGRRLRRSVFDALLPALGGRTRLLICPDGDLTRVPFEVLPEDDGARLVDRFSISYANTGRDVLRFGARSNRTPAMPLVVADPSFDLGRPPPADVASAGGPGRRWRDLRFGRLPAARAEGEGIAALLGVLPWLADEALEGRLKARCRSPRILHLATHGFFLEDQADCGDIPGKIGTEGHGRPSGPLPENPLLRSGLALAGANTWLAGGSPPEEAEDGLLTAEDVTGLDLIDTDLVVLSACETGLGQVHTGEGVFGLQRAFMLAGARTLVMSLWAVPDEATRLLMEGFYGDVLSGVPRAEALRLAQHSVRTRYPEPLYWGAFVCLGDPGPLPT